MTTTTHWWLYEILVENEIRNTTAKVSFSWFAPSVTAFHAVVISGPKPKHPQGNIRISFNERLVGDHTKKADAVGHLRKLVDAAPPQCRADFEAHLRLLLDTVG